MLYCCFCCLRTLTFVSMDPDSSPYCDSSKLSTLERWPDMARVTAGRAGKIKFKCSSLENAGTWLSAFAACQLAYSCGRSCMISRFDRAAAGPIHVMTVLIKCCLNPSVLRMYLSPPNSKPTFCLIQVKQLDAAAGCSRCHNLFIVVKRYALHGG